MLSNIKASERVDDNNEIFYPGERTLNTRNKNLKEGIPVDKNMVWYNVLGIILHGRTKLYDRYIAFK